MRDPRLADIKMLLGLSIAQANQGPVPVENQPKPGLADLLKIDIEDFEKILSQIEAFERKIAPKSMLPTTGFSVSETSKIQNDLSNKFKQKEYENPEFLLAWRAMFHNFGETRNQLKRFLFARRLAVSELIRSLIWSLENDNPITFLSNMRSLYEYIAHAHQLMVETIKYHDSIVQIRADDITHIGTIIHKYTMQTRIDWVSTNSEKIKQYKKDEKTAEINEKSIMTSIDLIGKKFPRTREVYDFLCEFAHPNIGGYIAYHQSKIISKKSSQNFFTVFDTLIGKQGEYQGIRSISNMIFLGLDNLTKLIQIFLDLFEHHNKIDTSIKHFIQSEIRREVSNNSAYWNQLELCPCGTGKSLVSCCVPRRIWNSKHRYLN